MNKIVVTGGTGLVGKSLQKILPDAIYLSSKDYDLTIEHCVKAMYDELKPEIVIHLAAIVGGIQDNINYPAEYFTDNVLMNTHVLEYAHLRGVKRFIGLSSTCAYPDKVHHIRYPLCEEFLHKGEPPRTNFEYAYAKRCLSVQIDAYNKQYGTKFQYLIPCNLYGENDKFEGTQAHFISALISKIHKAKQKEEKTITLMGTGKPLRQFMHSDDLAWVIKYCLDNDIYENMNVAGFENLSIEEMTYQALDVIGYGSIENIEYDYNQPDGQFWKDVSIQKLLKHIPTFKPKTLKEGIKQTYEYIKDQL